MSKAIDRMTPEQRAERERDLARIRARRARQLNPALRARETMRQQADLAASLAAAGAGDRRVR